MNFYAARKIYLAIFNYFNAVLVHMHVRVGHQRALQDANPKQIQVKNVGLGSQGETSSFWDKVRPE